MENTGIKPEIKQKIIALLSALFKGVKIYLYGSRAKGIFRERSDIDIAIDAGRPLSRVELDEAKTVLEGTNILLKMDLVDLQSVGKDFRDSILKECIRWK